MTRKEQLKAIPYPVEQGESEKDKRDYALALEVAEHWQTVPKTHEEREAMIPRLPRKLKWAYDRGEIRGHGGVFAGQAESNGGRGSAADLERLAYFRICFFSWAIASRSRSSSASSLS